MKNPFLKLTIFEWQHKESNKPIIVNLNNIINYYTSNDGGSGQATDILLVGNNYIRVKEDISFIAFKIEDFYENSI